MMSPFRAPQYGASSYPLVNLEKLRDIEADRLNIIESIPTVITRPYYEF